MNQADILAALAQLAEHHLDDVGIRVDEYGLPPECVEPIRAEVATALAGCRLTFTRWSPRPALVDEAESAAFLAALEDAVASEVQAAYTTPTSKPTTYLERRDIAAARCQQALMAWNKRRPARQDLPTERGLENMFGRPVIKTPQPS